MLRNIRSRRPVWLSHRIITTRGLGFYANWRRLLSGAPRLRGPRDALLEAIEDLMGRSENG